MLQPSTTGTVHSGPRGDHVPVVRLACTTCQLVYEPDPAAFGTPGTPAARDVGVGPGSPSSAAAIRVVISHGDE